jgi:hypothetical protein
LGLSGIPPSSSLLLSDSKCTSLSFESLLSGVAILAVTHTHGSTKYGRPAPTQTNAQAIPEPIILDGLIKDLKEVLRIEGNREKYLDTLIKKGFYSRTQLAILAGTLHIRMLFIFQGNRLEIPVQFHSFKETKEQLALVDSGAMENFMDQATVKRLHLGTKKLTHAIPV